MALRYCFKDKQNKAFTLIELLVVIAIIGLLSSVVLVSMQGIRAKARIAKSLEFSQSVQHALGAYAAGWWNFETIEAGNQVIDGSGYNNHGTVNGATLVAGLEQLGNALSFDGNDYVSIPNSIVNLAGDFTVEQWVSMDPTQVSANSRILSMIDGSNNYQIAIYSSLSGNYGKITARLNGSSIITNDSGVTFDNIWHHIVFTRSGSVWTIYVNGAVFASSSGGITGDAVFSAIGSGYQTAAYSTRGLIDEVRIYSHVLSTMEIQKHYVEESGKHQNLAVK